MGVFHGERGQLSLLRATTAEREYTNDVPG